MMKIWKFKIKDQPNKLKKLNKMSHKTNCSSLRISTSKWINLSSVNHKLQLKFNNISKLRFKAKFNKLKKLILNNWNKII